jgi:hypothetical protein
MARWTASAEWAEGPALDGQRDMPLALSLSEWLGFTCPTGERSLFQAYCHAGLPAWAGGLPAGNYFGR